MTTNTNEALRPLIESIDAVNENRGDAYEIIATLKPFVAGPVFEALALTFDMCPIHLTDLDSCADDDVLEIQPHVMTDPIDVPLYACRHFRPRA